MSSKVSSKEVILCRGIVDNNDTLNEYIKIFQTAGYTCKYLPVMSFEFLNLNSLKDSLLSPNSYGGLIVTSRRAIEAIRSALQEHSLPDQWNDLPVFCVGPSTALFAETTLSLKRCTGSNCGNSKELANYIVNEIKQDTKPLLYPCSAIARDTIEQILSTNGIKFEKLFVYDTLPSVTLENDLTRIVNEKLQIFVFFSPSAVEYTLNVAQKRPCIIEKIQAVAIGPVTAEAIVRANIIVHAVASKPDPNSLLRAIQMAEL